MEPNYNHFWWAIEGVLGGMAMPFIHPERRMNYGGERDAYEDELPRLYEMGIRAIVCLLNMPGDLPVFQSAGFDFRCYPIGGGQPPTMEQAREFVMYMAGCHLRKLPVAVFCEAGAGRTGTMIACYLIHLGKTAEQAIAELRMIDPSTVETDSQILFLEEFERQHKSNG